MNLLAMSLLCIAPLGHAAHELNSTDAMRHDTSPSSMVTPHFESTWKETSFTLFDDLEPETSSTPFGAAGSWRWQLGTGGALDLRNSRNRLVQVGVGASYFIVDNLSLNAEFNTIYFSQVGEDAVGANLNLSFSHHLIVTDHWSLFAEAGAGMLGTSNRVPTNGSRFNFVPHAGGGMSFDVGSNVRLLTGVRWHHISNANTHRDNPGRDSLQVYVALSFPF